MTVRVTREAEPQFDLFGAYEGEVLGGAENTLAHLTFTASGDYLIVVPKNDLSQPQVEAGSTPSSYIPTNGSTVTRAGETLTAPSDNLPWPEPVVIGDELVTNGTFDTDISGWTDSSIGTGSIAFSSGTMLLTSNGSSDLGITDQSMTTVVGKIYKLQLEITASSGSVNSFKVGTTQNGVQYGVINNIGVGLHTFYFVATSTTLWFRFNGHFGVGTTNIDNISVREINPLAVSIAMEGGETFADLDTAGQVTLYDRRVDANNRITLTLDTDGAKTGTFTLTLVNGGSSETISTTGEITPDVNEPFNVAFVATSNELGIALNGTAETRVSHSLGLPDLSTVDATYEGAGTRKLVREWADDIGNAGMEAATS